MSIAEPSTATARDHRFLPGHSEVGEELPRFGVVDQGTDRYARHGVCAAFSMLRLSPPVLAAPGFDTGLELKIEECPEPAIGAEPDVAAAATVASRRSTVRAVFLTQERHAGTPAVAGFHMDQDFVDELHGGL
jgi:hypothetical protein